MISKFFKKKSVLEQFLKDKNKEKDSKILEKENLESRIFKTLKSVKYQISSFFISDHFNFEDLQEETEKLLLKFDFGPTLAVKLSENITNTIKFARPKKEEEVKKIFKKELINVYGPCEQSNVFKENIKTNIWLIAGTNGCGKTTSIAKLAHLYKGKKILLIAADTFRAAAVEQLKEWAMKLNIDILEPEKEKEDPASLIYKGLKNNENYDLIICDTSGRQHNKVNLMQEMEKIYKIIKKFDTSAPHQSFLVLDATHGQTSFSQAEAFFEATNATGIILTKLDNTNRGGFVFSIRMKYKIPVKFVGVGEKLTDLLPFNVEMIAEKISDLIEIKNSN